MLSALVISLLIGSASGEWITVPNGGPWGEWGIPQQCPCNTSARGFRLKVEEHLPALGDDTALNGIELFCAPPSSNVASTTITSTEGPWGRWGHVLWCSEGNIISFALQVQSQQGVKDDTAANNIKFQCSRKEILTGAGGPWGSYGNWSKPCRNGICGIQTKVEPEQKLGDDTALNDVMFQCC